MRNFSLIAIRTNRADPDRYLIPDIMPSVAMLAQGIFSPSSENPVPIALGLWREERREELQAHKRLPLNLLPLSSSASIYNLKATISFSMTFSQWAGSHTRPGSSSVQCHAGRVPDNPETFDAKRKLLQVSASQGTTVGHASAV